MTFSHYGELHHEFGQLAKTNPLLKHLDFSWMTILGTHKKGRNPIPKFMYPVKRVHLCISQDFQLQVPEPNQLKTA